MLQLANHPLLPTYLPPFTYIYTGTARQTARAQQLAEEAESARIEAQKIADDIAKADQTPARLVLLEGKGIKIDTEVEIAEEGAFHEVEEEDGDDDFGAEYMDFGRKYYGIVLQNAAGRKVRPPQGSVVVTCQVHRVGISQPLASTPLVDAWSDGAYYFSSAVFMRSGDYTISFVVEGLNAMNIEPLVYAVHVQAKITKCGPVEAMSKLNALPWVAKADRRTLVPRIKRSQLLAKVAVGRCVNEFEYVRASLLTVFAALPMGCLSAILVEDRRSSSSRVKRNSNPADQDKEARNEDVSEAAGKY